MDGFFRMLEKAVSELICTRLYIHKFEKQYSVDVNLAVDINSVVYEFSGVYENTVAEENSVDVCKSSVKMVDENSVVAQFSGVD